MTSVNEVSRAAAKANYMALTWETRCPRGDCTRRPIGRTIPDQRVYALSPGLSQLTGLG
jgi:hypothetical protein